MSYLNRSVARHTTLAARPPSRQHRLVQLAFRTCRWTALPPRVFRRSLECRLRTVFCVSKIFRWVPPPLRGVCCAVGCSSSSASATKDETNAQWKRNGWYLLGGWERVSSVRLRDSATTENLWINFKEISPWKSGDISWGVLIIWSSFISFLQLSFTNSVFLQCLNFIRCYNFSY